MAKQIDPYQELSIYLIAQMRGLIAELHQIVDIAERQPKDQLKKTYQALFNDMSRTRQKIDKAQHDAGKREAVLLTRRAMAQAKNASGTSTPS